MTSLADLSAVELGRLYAAGDTSPTEVTEAVIARIEAWEPKLNATWAFAGAVLPRLARTGVPTAVAAAVARNRRRVIGDDVMESFSVGN